MKKMILMAAFMLSTVVMVAQNSVGSFSLKPHVGVVGSELTEFDDTKMKIGFVTGAEAEYQITDMISLSAGALYSQQGVQLNDGFNVNVFGAEFKKDDTKLNLNYINIPVLANVYVVPGLAVKLGVQPSFLVGENKSKANTFNFSIPVGLSYEFANIFIDGRYNWGVTKVWENEKPKSSVFQVTLGYKFGL